MKQFSQYPGRFQEVGLLLQPSRRFAVYGCIDLVLLELAEDKTTIALSNITLSSSPLNYLLLHY